MGAMSRLGHAAWSGGTVAPRFGHRRSLVTFSEWMAVMTRAKRVVYLVILIWVLNGVDLLLSIEAQAVNMLDESNPIAAILLRRGVPAIVAYKLSLVFIGSYPLLRFRRRRLAELVSIGTLVVYSLVCIRWAQCYDMYTAAISVGREARPRLSPSPAIVPSNRMTQAEPGVVVETTDERAVVFLH